MTHPILRPLGLLAASLALAGTALAQQQPTLTSYVDPLIGSGGHGHVFVGANIPFGAVQLGPMNIFKGWDWCSGYHYSDSLITGFAHTHLSGTGASDLGDVLIMPYTGALRTDKGRQQAPHQGYLSRYSHQRETARPGYYAVTLDDYGIQAELTSTARVGMHRYTFPAGGKQPARVIIDLAEGVDDKATDTYLEQRDARTFLGRRFSHGWADHQQLFFAIQVSEAVPEFALFNGTQAVAGKKAQGLAVKGVFTFAKAPKTLLLKVGISPVSAQNALANITSEIPEWDFEAVRKEADQHWEHELGKITADLPDPATRRTFYTALYHAWFAPALFNDNNQEYRGIDGKVYKPWFENYTTFSLWDTYRTEHSLFTLAQPERVPDMMQSMLAIGQQQGKLPIWHLMGNETNCMVGYSAVPALAEAFLKGVGNLDGRELLAQFKQSSTRDDQGVQYLKTLGFIPADKENESVAKALEYAIDDWSIAQVAKKVGATADYQQYSKRAAYYRRYFDPKTRFMRGVTADGKFQLPFDAFQSIHRQNPYTEGNAWQYTWLVPHDVPGLIKLFGTEASFVEKLDSLFVVKGSLGKEASPDISGLIGMYAHGNEPSHATTYLYAYAGQQWKTAEKVRQILRELYRDQPDGLSGNEDCGQMSAWYIMSALGFYPVSPSSGAYVIGSPLVNKAVLHLPQGKTFTVEAVGNSPQNIYVQSAMLNGKAYANTYLLHRTIVAGGTLKLVMGPQPNKLYGASPFNRPRIAYE